MTSIQSLQQENFGRAGLSKCCKKGIYLTDVCLPGKCSNHTTQLCCFQKFLQARYRCCEDDNQSLGPSSTSDFNKCCYDHFVNEDVCCNMKLAARYWKTVHELCYPNTKVDYSGIKLEVSMVCSCTGVKFLRKMVARLPLASCLLVCLRLQMMVCP
uniref:GDNF domain-containing protein n=1 Tax=Angiostrongylus cantonensis TaxID=6313 RepID=A0A0K0DHR1_ANGCA